LTLFLSPKTVRHAFPNVDIIMSINIILRTIVITVKMIGSISKNRKHNLNTSNTSKLNMKILRKNYYVIKQLTIQVTI